MNKLFFLLRNTLKNKVFFYLISRYLIYFISFISSMIIANKLPPYYMGIWGSILLLIRYFTLFDLGIGNSMTVLLVQSKNDKRTQADIEKTSMTILGMMSTIVICIALYYSVFGIPFIAKFNLGNLFYAVCIIAIIQYFNDYFLKIYRVKGKMFEFTFYQSIIQIIVFLIVLIVNKSIELVYALVSAHVLGNVLALILFLTRGGINWSGTSSYERGKIVLSKGFMLFVYNTCFYFIMISTKTIISAYYSIEEFGYFTFAYTLSNAAMLLLSAFSSLVTPKLLDKFNTNDISQIKSTVRILRVNYIYMSHGLMYAAMVAFPVILMFVPQYSDSLLVINLSALATLLYTNSFGYISLLMTKNQEGKLARNTFICLLVNIFMALFLVNVLKATYEYIILATLITYVVYAYITVYTGQKVIGQPINFYEITKECLPVEIMVPYVGAVIISLINNKYLMFIPLLLFISINGKAIKEIITSIKKVFLKPEIIDITD